MSKYPFIVALKAGDTINFADGTTLTTPTDGVFSIDSNTVYRINEPCPQDLDPADEDFMREISS